MILIKSKFQSMIHKDMKHIYNRAAMVLDLLNIYLLLEYETYDDKTISDEIASALDSIQYSIDLLLTLNTDS